jgi:hypothetical protein
MSEEIVMPDENEAPENQTENTENPLADSQLITPTEQPVSSNETGVPFPTPDTTVPDYVSPLTTDIEFEKYKMKINLYKWMLGTFFITVITIVINWGFKDRAQGMTEISQYDKYATDMIILNDNPVKKRMLAQFFAHVTPSEKLKEGWQDYYKDINKEYLVFMKKDSILRLNYNGLIKKDTTKLNVSEKAKLKVWSSQVEQNDLIINAPTITPDGNLSTTQQTIYIQYANKNKKTEVEDIRKQLQNNNWLAPGTEYVAGSYNNQIKYFYDEDKSFAESVNMLLGGNYETVFTNTKRQVPKGQIEIWIANN